MDFPIFTPESWAKGKYNSYSLHPNGTLVESVAARFYGKIGSSCHVNQICVDPILRV